MLERSSVSLVTTHYKDRVPRSRAQCVFLNKDLCTALYYQQGESLGLQECKPYNHHSQWPIPTTLCSTKWEFCSSREPTFANGQSKNPMNCKLPGLLELLVFRDQQTCHHVIKDNPPWLAEGRRVAVTRGGQGGKCVEPGFSTWVPSFCALFLHPSHTKINWSSSISTHSVPLLETENRSYHPTCGTKPKHPVNGHRRLNGSFM